MKVVREVHSGAEGARGWETGGGLETVVELEGEEAQETKRRRASTAEGIVCFMNGMTFTPVSKKLPVRQGNPSHFTRKPQTSRV